MVGHRETTSLVMFLNLFGSNDQSGAHAEDYRNASRLS
jgi:hypothetical protein